MKITIVVVIYNLKVEKSKTYQTLKQTLFSNKELLSNIDLILYDNSPEPQELNPLEFEGGDIIYHHDKRNLGISSAYNYALTVANQNGSKWLLLLDHDTELTNEYINLITHLEHIPSDVAAVVPKISSENKMISPVYSHSLRPLQEENPKLGIQNKPVMAINSASLISIDFLNQIDGFSDEFPLDYLDHWVFYKIYEKGYKVWLLDVTLEHELSVMDYSRVSLRRYQSILDSEMIFFKNYKKDLYPAYRIQLVKRFLKQVVTVKNKKIAQYTLKRLLSM
jgi:GT2 family glycosyltransferase